MWVFAPRLSLIVQDRDLNFFTQKKNETVVVFLEIFFFFFGMNILVYREERCFSLALVCGYQLEPALLISYSVL